MPEPNPLCVTLTFPLTGGDSVNCGLPGDVEEIGYMVVSYVTLKLD